MYLIRLEAKNIFSLGDVDLNLECRGLTLVRGYSKDENDSNGSGKSSLAHKAITWGLWGQTIIGAKADAVLKNGEKTGWCRVTFRSQANERYRVTRERKKKLGKVWLEAYTADGWEKVPTPKIASQTQEQINSLLGSDFKTWANTSFFGQGRKWAFAELTPAARYELLEEILPIEDLRRWFEQASEETKERGSALTTLYSERTRWEARIKTDTEQIALAKDASLKWNTNRDMKIQATQEELETYDRDQAVVQDRLKELHTQRQLVWTAPGEKHWEQAEADTVKKQKLVEKHVAEADLLVGQWERELAKLEALTFNIKKYCERCKNPLTDQQVTDLTEKLSGIKTSINEAKGSLAAATTAREFWRSTSEGNNKLLDQYREQRMAYHKKQEEYQALSLQIRDLEGMQEEKFRTALCERLLELHDSQDPHQNPLVRAEQEVANMRGHLVSLSHEIDWQVEHRTHLEFWKRAFGTEIRVYLLQQVCEYLNVKARKYLSQMGNPQLEVTFSTEKEQASGSIKEEFNVSVTSATGGSSFQLLSGGEQAIASFAIGLALSDLASTQSAGHSGFMVLDEPFTNLGETNCARLVQFLTTFSNQRETVLLISNEHSLSDLIPNKIEVEKHDGTTRIV
jgi:DNA repair exonuclease SbcCD ATPase subunit